MLNSKQTPLLPSSSAGTMSDDAKRRAKAMDGFEVLSEDASGGDRLLASLIGDGCKTEISDEDNDRLSKYVPKGIQTFQQWGRTVSAFGKLSKLDIPLGYKEILADDKYSSYVQWCRGHMQGSQGAAGDFVRYIRFHDMIYEGIESSYGCFEGTTVPRRLK